MKFEGAVFSLICCAILSTSHPAQANAISKFTKRALLYPVFVAISPVVLPAVYDFGSRGFGPKPNIMDNRLILYTVGVASSPMYMAVRYFSYFGDCSCR
jgi:hypothetical protein